MWRRPRHDRLVAGVASGVAAEIGLPTWMVRTGFVVATLFGGLGVAAYIAGWVLMPNEDEERSVMDGWVQRIDEAETTSSKVGVGLMVVAGLIILSSLGIFSAPVLLAVLLFALGIKLITIA